MGRYAYPNVPAPSSQPVPTPSQAELQSRGFSWVPEPRNGALHDPSSAPPMPAMPAQTAAQHPATSNPPQVHQQPSHPPEQPAYILSNQTTENRYPPYTETDRHQQTLSVSTFRTGTPVPAYTRNDLAEDHNTTHLAQPQQTNDTTTPNSRQLHLSTRSLKAPEVVIHDPLPPLPEHHQHQQTTPPIEPDANPLHTSSNTSPSSQRPILSNPNAAYLPHPTPSTTTTWATHDTQGGTWHHALCSCADTPTCLTALFCPCILYGRTQHRLDRRASNRDPLDLSSPSGAGAGAKYTATNGSCLTFAALFCGCNLVLAAIQHVRIRRMYGMGSAAGDGNVGNDCLMGVCCCCCTLAMDEKEIKAREAGVGVGEKEKELARGYRMTSPMSYPSPPSGR